jgi:oxygen-independent coproporphyrinogen-3 oxidase
MNDDTLRKIGRLHSSQDVVDKYYMARDLGFNNINMDTIIGLPGEGEGHVVRTMERLKELSPDNITIHTMALKRASKLNEMEVKIRNRTAESMYNIAAKGARDMGMYPYYMYRQKNMVSPLENVGYCKKGMECIYNIQMIAENISIVSFGADAITKLVFQDENRIERAANVKDVKEYINRIDEMISNKIEAISLLTK